jgi:hypothetical protein
MQRQTERERERERENCRDPRVFSKNAKGVAFLVIKKIGFA